MKVEHSVCEKKPLHQLNRITKDETVTVSSMGCTSVSSSVRGSIASEYCRLPFITVSNTAAGNMIAAAFGTVVVHFCGQNENEFDMR